MEYNVSHFDDDYQCFANTVFPLESSIHRFFWVYAASCVFFLYVSTFSWFMNFYVIKSSRLAEITCIWKKREYVHTWIAITHHILVVASLF